jgi:hypothetical protein
MQALLRGDHAARAAFYASGITNGWLSRNEARASENLNKEDGLDEFLAPFNMGTQAERDAAMEDRAPKDMAPMEDGKSRERKLGRVISAANERRIVNARDELDVVLTSLAPKDGDA